MCNTLHPIQVFKSIQDIYYLEAAAARIYSKDIFFILVSPLFPYFFFFLFLIFFSFLFLCHVNCCVGDTRKSLLDGLCQKRGRMGSWDLSSSSSFCSLSYTTKTLASVCFECFKNSLLLFSAEESRATAVPALRPPRQAKTVYISLTDDRKRRRKFPPPFFLPFPIVEDGRQGRPSCCPSRGKSSSSAWLNTF